MRATYKILIMDTSSEEDCLVLKFKEYLISRKRDEFTKHLVAEDLKLSIVGIVKLVQTEVFSKEIKDLEGQGRVKCLSKLVKLRPILDNGLMRVVGRIFDAAVSVDARFSMIFSPNHSVTQRLITSYHQKLGNSCQSRIQAQMREIFGTQRGFPYFARPFDGI